MSATHMRKPSETNWAMVDALTDKTIDTSDIAPLTQAHLMRMTLRMPEESMAITVNVDPDILAWFRAQGDKFEKRVNAALKIYVEAHKDNA